MRTLNLGTLAHVDAGETTLTERPIYAAGVIDEVGSVDDGSTQTDSLALESHRGITIEPALVSFVVDNVKVNLICNHHDGSDRRAGHPQCPFVSGVGSLAAGIKEYIPSNGKEHALHLARRI